MKNYATFMKSEFAFVTNKISDYFIYSATP